MKPMSAELEASLAKPREQRLNPETQQVLEAVATRLLRKSGMKRAKYIPVNERVIPAEGCGVHGLRPTWHGRAS